MSEWFVGGYTADMGGSATGIGVLRSRADGSLENVGTAASTDSPSYLLVTESTVFAAGESTGRITAFPRGLHEIAVARSHFVGGDTTSLGPATTGDSGGGEPCHLGLYGDALVVACYTDGIVSALDWNSLAMRSILTSEGSGPRSEQTGPRAHSSAQLADGRIVTADLGADRLHVHTLVGGTLVRESSVDLPAGTGPRDLHVLSNGLILLLGEFGCEIHVLTVADDSSISREFSVPLPGAVAGDQAAAIAVTADERFVYSGLRGSNRISFSPLTLETDPTGRPCVRFAPGGFVPAEGDWPRHLIVDGDILHVANQRSSSVASFRLGADDTPTLIAEPTPVASPTVLAKA